MMRLFIAINFSKEMKQELREVIQNLKEESVSGNFTRTENMHLTLAFLGELPDQVVDDIIKAMEETATLSSPFTMELSQLGKFRIHGENLYWCGVTENESLRKIQKLLVGNLRTYRIPFDHKEFQPHITLGRRCKMKQDFNENVFNEGIKPMKMTVDTISLMKSERIEGKLCYTSLIDVKLPG